MNDLELMIDFWSSILRYKLVDADQYHDPKQIYWSLVDPNNNGPRLIIQRVPEPVTAKLDFILMYVRMTLMPTPSGLSKKVLNVLTLNRLMKSVRLGFACSTQKATRCASH